MPSENPDDTPREAKEWARIYAPKKTDGSFEEMMANRKLGEGKIVASKLVRGKPRTKEEATLPFSEALPAYVDAAERAMNEGSIPPEYRDRVKGYFDLLK